AALRWIRSFKNTRRVPNSASSITASPEKTEPNLLGQPEALFRGGRGRGGASRTAQSQGTRGPLDGPPLSSQTDVPGGGGAGRRRARATGRTGDALPGRDLS